MLSILYILQFIITAVVILLVMFQKGKGSAGLISSNPYNAFFANKAIVANPLTKITIIFGVALFINSIAIGAIELHGGKPKDSIISKIEKMQTDKPAVKSTNKNTARKIPTNKK